MITIGRHGALTLEQARMQAKQLKTYSNIAPVPKGAKKELVCYIGSNALLFLKHFFLA